MVNSWVGKIVEFADFLKISQNYSKILKNKKTKFTEKSKIIAMIVFGTFFYFKVTKRLMNMV